MTWFAAAAVTVSTVGSYASGVSSSNSAIKGANSSAAQQNEALRKQYLHSIVRNSYATGAMNVALGQDKKRMRQQGFDKTVQAAAVKGAAESQIAATGTVGASADAVMNDIDMKLGEAQAVDKESYEQLLTNYNNDLASMNMNAQGELLGTNPVKVTDTTPSTGMMLGSALMAGLSTYMGAKSMSLGSSASGGSSGSGISLGGTTAGQLSLGQGGATGIFHSFL